MWPFGGLWGVEMGAAGWLVACGALLGFEVSAVWLVALFLPCFWCMDRWVCVAGGVGWCFENCTVDASI